MNPNADLVDVVWRKSSYSDGGGTNCVEVADGVPGLVPIRDSKVVDGPSIVFGRDAWAVFVARCGS
ncbi:DUF397 domain-containing protein [Streptomyces griseoviridis]|jgi:hypothetical protein|uniref:DUF397 domain-containing protein n=3 Tax=Streptomyces TaxID=1883 RepID=A0A918GTC0_STRGD|nr:MULTISPECIES: DUF397 domain-containing protein [Streptomyces]MDP9682699.1 hypothetical protein [Streptomyces griseoviridis]GGS58344.1 hypothetical protein GCM10010238_54510 [Streptomyces niveoruber]GGT11187.1 hypothetical protein GCM10010240_50740 [Streptomyces griseoviridis]GGU55097.1 hypothetical protein GCM10010259_52920 [Streptomyces daghestanicus]GHI32327.1 hypothetical protein Sdagh_40570 [Streptomyces daghestanicus]